ncbi:DinB family protein [Frigidibacter sp.]|uniref:DinB family protein n=1 Tax=Frigidibacter sp. TaxID=2586418 RepID=UPI002736BD23|nr:DinB family protein [Frigidibacter sp.]MDP3341102.1 DinB family protein [Frigidibacter sp.]
MDICRPYRQMARNALLANRRLHAAIATLPTAEWEASRVSFFPSLRATLAHVLLVDAFYLMAMEGGVWTEAAEAEVDPCATPDDWLAAQEKLDMRLLERAEALVAQDLGLLVQIHRTGRVQVETLGDTLLHLFLHDQHHRGQVHAMLAGTAVPPPQLDEFIMADDAAARAQDLVALGRDEPWIMR